MLGQIMETQPEYETDSGRRQGRVDDIILPIEDEFRVISVITHSLGQYNHGEGSLHRVLNSSTRSESSNGS